MLQSQIQKRFVQKRSIYSDIYLSDYSTLARNLLYRIWQFNTEPEGGWENFIALPYSSTNLPDKVIPSTDIVDHYSQTESILDVYRAVLDLDVAIRKILSPWDDTTNDYANIYSLINLLGEITLDKNIPESIADLTSIIGPLSYQANFLADVIGPFPFAEEEVTEYSSDGLFSATTTTKFIGESTTEVNLVITIQELVNGSTSAFVPGGTISIRPYPTNANEFRLKGHVNPNGMEILVTTSSFNIALDEWGPIPGNGFVTTIITSDVPGDFSVKVPFVTLLDPTVKTLEVIIDIDGSEIILPIGHTCISVYDTFLNIGNIYKKTASSECKIDGYNGNISQYYLLENIHSALFGSTTVASYPLVDIPLIEKFRLLISDKAVATNGAMTYHSIAELSDISENSGTLFVYGMLFNFSYNKPDEYGVVLYPSGVYDPYRDDVNASSDKISDRGLISRDPCCTMHSSNISLGSANPKPTNYSYAYSNRNIDQNVGTALSSDLDIDMLLPIIDGYIEITNDLSNFSEDIDLVSKEFANTREESIAIGQTVGVANPIGSVSPTLLDKISELETSVNKVIQMSAVSGVTDSIDDLSIAERYSTLKELANKIGAAKFGITNADIMNFAKSDQTTRILKIFRDILGILALKDSIDNIVSNPNFKGINNIAIGSNGGQSCLMDVATDDELQGSLNTSISLGDFFNAHCDIYPRTVVPYHFIAGPLDKSSAQKEYYQSIQWNIDSIDMAETTDVVTDIKLSANGAGNVFTIIVTTSMPDMFRQNQGLVGFWFKLKDEYNFSPHVPSRYGFDEGPNHFITNYIYDSTTERGTITYRGRLTAIMKYMGPITLITFNSGKINVGWQTHFGNPESDKDYGTWSTFGWIAVRNDFIGATRNGLQHVGIYTEAPTDEDMLGYI